MLISFCEIAAGMKLPLSRPIHYKPVTLQGPHEKQMLSENYCDMLALLRYDDGTEKRIGWDLCEAVCSFHIMTVVSRRSAGPTDETRRTRVFDGHDAVCVLCPMPPTLSGRSPGDDTGIRVGGIRQAGLVPQ